MNKLIPPLIPNDVIIDFVSNSPHPPGCPKCGETRTTNCIYGFLTYLCGSSGSANKEKTICQGNYWEKFVENSSVA